MPVPVPTPLRSRRLSYGITTSPLTVRYSSNLQYQKIHKVNGGMSMSAHTFAARLPVWAARVGPGRAGVSGPVIPVGARAERALSALRVAALLGADLRVDPLAAVLW